MTTKHILTIKGGRHEFYVAGNCSCGQFSEFLNMVTRRGDVTSNKEFIKRKFKAHKAGA